MKTVARLSAEDRSDLFRNTANRMQMSDAIVEKDFWVCFTLDYLFHRSPWKDSITFKGGTSLSKAYHLINRFSEDIDLILDWRILGYSLNEPWEERSNTKQDTFNKEATILYENHTWSARAAGHGTTDRIPDDWIISSERLKKMFEKYGK